MQAQINQPLSAELAQIWSEIKVTCSDHGQPRTYVFNNTSLAKVYEEVYKMYLPVAVQSVSKR